MLRRSRAVLVAVAFAGVAGGLVLAFRQQALDEVVRAQEARNVVLARIVANTVWGRFADHVKTATPAKLEDLRANTATRDLNAAITAVVRDTPIHRVKVYNISGLTVFSSNIGQIGESRADYPAFRHAVDHKTPSSALSFRETFVGFSGGLTSIHLVETYVPIKGPDGAVEGIFELYTETNAAIRRAEDAVTRFGAIVAAGLGLLYGIAVWALGGRQRRY